MIANEKEDPIVTSNSNNRDDNHYDEGSLSASEHPNHAASHQQDQQLMMMIRHSGNVQIRGRIRRVWRCRFLELLDNGQLRLYYNHHNHHHYSNTDESSNTKKINLNTSATSTKSTTGCKYTLTVYSARILDSTTLRDLHVGLPRGSFGFCLRGQRNHYQNHIDNDDEEADAVVLPLSLQDDDEATITNKSTNNTSSNSYDDVLLPEQQQEYHQQEPVRDYLCAVDTLEEAQMWVVALQWAASCNNNSDGGASSSTEQWWKVDVEKPVVPTERKKKIAPSSVAQPQVAASKRQPSSKEISGAKQQQQKQQGKILVTKVVGYTVVRAAGGTSLFSALEIAYEIHALLLLGHDKAEQWVVFRTANDLRAALEQQQQQQQQKQQLLDSDTANATKVLQRIATWKDRPTVVDLKRSVSILDNLLRSWVLDPNIINAAPVKDFLGLGHSVSSSAPSFLWQPHRSFSVCNHTYETVPPSNNRNQHDTYVKTWLLQRRQERSSTWKHTLQDSVVELRHSHSPIMWGVFAASASVLPLVVRRIPSISMRLDVLVVSWIGAAYFGRYYSNKMEPQRLPLPVEATSRRLGTPSSRRKGRLSSRVPPTTIKKTVSRRKQDDTANELAINVSNDDSTVIIQDDSEQIITEYGDDDETYDEFMSTGSREVLDKDESDGEESSESERMESASYLEDENVLSSPLPKYPDNEGVSCWSQPADDEVFCVRGSTYFTDRLKVPSGPAPLKCRGVDIWLTDDPQRHIARHPAVLGGKLNEKDTFLVNFLLPFGNFVAYFEVPPLQKFPDKVRTVWTKWLKGDQQYRDARLKLLPYVVEGPWIVKTAVGPGKSPALLGKVIPLQYFFRDPSKKSRGVYEVDVIITASTIAKGILSVVKSQTNAVTIAFAFIIEAAEQSELPETVLCSFQIHSVHLEDCAALPECDLDDC